MRACWLAAKSSLRNVDVRRGTGLRVRRAHPGRWWCQRHWWEDLRPAQGSCDQSQINYSSQAANVEVEPFWPGLFAKALEGSNPKELLTNISSGAGAPAAASAAAPAAGAAAAEKQEEKKEDKKKKEESEEEDDDMGFGLFD